MKVSDYISKSIQEYPSLYKDVDYEKSKLKVLCQAFFTIGNGLEFADTENTLEGGYVVDPKMKKDKRGEWIRIKDKPYGTEKYKPLPEGYFDSVVYYVYAAARPLDTIYKKDKYDDNILFRYSKKVATQEFMEPKLYKAESLYPFHPYPFSKDFSLACDVYYKNIFLQEDWMKELIFLCKRTLEFFIDPEQYKLDSYYPSEASIIKDFKYFQETFKRDGAKGVKNLRKTWVYSPSGECPTMEEVYARKKEAFDNYHKRQISFLKKFLKKFYKPL